MEEEEELDRLEGHFGALPPTLSSDQYYWFRHPEIGARKDYDLGCGTYLLKGFSRVPADAGVGELLPMPDWFADAHWGKHCEAAGLDRPENVSAAKGWLAEQEPETDHQQKSEHWLARYEAKKGEEWEPWFDRTRQVACGLLTKWQLSIDRAVGLIDQYWNPRNKPPLPRAELHQIVEKEYNDRDGNECPQLRWRWRRDDERKAGGSGSLADWLSAEIPAPDFLCGEVISTATKTLLYAPTGKGKTTFCLALAAAIAAGRDFLHWKGPRKPRRVLYVDGEMPQALMQARLRDAVRRLGVKPDGLIVLSQDRQPEMPPLDTEEGQRWLDFYVEDHGPFDLVVFDNLQALTSGSLIGAETWRAMMEWTKD